MGVTAGDGGGPLTSPRTRANLPPPLGVQGRPAGARCVLSMGSTRYAAVRRIMRLCHSLLSEGLSLSYISCNNRFSSYQIVGINSEKL